MHGSYFEYMVHSLSSPGVSEILRAGVGEFLSTLPLTAMDPASTWLECLEEFLAG